MNNAKILVIEDESAIRNLISTALQTNGYKNDVAPNGSTALLSLSTQQYDLVLLDLGLPDTDGIEIIKKYRTFSTTPIIVISARSNDNDKIIALDEGADDYLTKPFNVEELLARVRSTIRRIQYSETKKTEEVRYFINGQLKIDYVSQTVYVSDEEIHLMPIEYSLLCLLAKNVGRVLTHRYILDKVWVNSIESDLSSLRVYLTSLRKKIEKKSNEKYIQTHIGVGYKMVLIKPTDAEVKNHE
ncbi:DNA-binding response regulator [Erysipelatoclostridium sp. An173]|uniref:response regulator transcription factor n=1 Tax=unclassified Thomasclavelia TaxID=3025756 RepID=UPI000B390A71|nr:MULTISPECIES: response regulator transcription factor [unclassified Thomasclavelia]OUP77504.1 DNA-binding response regulator [Erysipelatoclostridium sp. An173]